MARPRSIKWRTRIQVFLCYRRLGKVYPVARQFRIARSTVNLIASEFKSSGFSIAPRAALSPTLLSLAQERHLTEVQGQLSQVQPIEIPNPPGYFGAGLPPLKALSEKAEEKVKQRDPVPLAEALDWHLRETMAEEAVSEARLAIRDYHLKCLALWKSIQRGLESECRFPVLVQVPADQRSSDPHIFHTFVDFLYQELWSRLGDPSASVAALGEWGPLPGEPAVLALLGIGTRVARGTPRDQQAVQEGTKKFLDRDLDNLRGKAQDLARLWHDLSYLEGIIKDALASVTEQNLREGICPGCPYPEGRIEVNEVNVPKRVRKGGKRG